MATPTLPLPVLDPDMPATLYRQDGAPDEDGGRGGAEDRGRLADMVERAMRDPGHETWRYSIAVRGHRPLTSGDITALSIHWRAPARYHG